MRRMTLQLTRRGKDETGELHGWYDGLQSYFVVRDLRTKQCLGSLEGRKLERFARAIVREFDRARRTREAGKEET